MPQWVAPITQAATLTTWLWELSAPVLLLAFWYRKTAEQPGRMRALFVRFDIRSCYLAFGVLLHVGIFVVMEVGTFSLVALATYTCAFHADEYRRLADRLRRLRPTG